MSDDPDLRDYVTQEKLIEIKEEFEKILKENEQLKQQMAFNNFINIGKKYKDDQQLYFQL